MAVKKAGFSPRMGAVSGLRGDFWATPSTYISSQCFCCSCHSFLCECHEDGWFGPAGVGQEVPEAGL